MSADAPTPLDLDAIKSSIAACRTYNFGMYQADRLAHEHAPALAAEVKRLRAEVALLRPALAQVKAEALREAADAVEHIDPEWDSALWIADPTSERGGAYHPVETWLRERADRLATEGGADRG